MKNDHDRSYKRYKQYRQNKNRYEQEQILIPVAIIIGIAILISLWKYILIAVVAVCFLAIVCFYLNKQLQSDCPIVLSTEDAKEGVEAKIYVTYGSGIVSFVYDIPPGVKDGQKFVAKKIAFKNKKGKMIKKNVHFKVQII